MPVPGHNENNIFFKKQVITIYEKIIFIGVVTCKNL